MEIMIIADDLTGAADTGVRFLNGGPVKMTDLNHRGRIEKVWGLAVDTSSRNAPEHFLPELMGRAAALVRSGQPKIIYKKIDSCLRGQIAYELSVLLEELDLWGALVAPAYPDLGRITKNGLHYVGDCLVSESESAFDPFWPVKDSRLSSVLSQNSSLRVRSLGLDLIRQGSQAVLKEIRSNRSEQRVLWAADAETEADLEVLALAGLAASDRFILCGSGGLAGALSRKLNGRQAKAQDDLKKPLADQPTLFLAGSTSVVLKQQIEVLVKTEGAQLITLNLAEFIGGNLTWPDNLKPALAKITGPLIINLPPREDKGGYSSRQIIESFGVLAASLIVELKPRCLFISGGDTARSVLNALGIGAAWLKAEIEPGVALLQAGPWSVLTKSGGFGDPELLRRLYLGSGPQAKKPKIKPGWPEEKLPEARLKAPRAGKKAGQKRESSQ